MKPTAKKGKAAPQTKEPYVYNEADSRAAKAMLKLRTAAPKPVRLVIEQQGADVDISTDHTDNAVGHMHIMAALGIADTRAQDRILIEMVNLATHEGKTSEKKLNELLSIVREIKPKDVTETLLAMQMAAIHGATITAARQLAATTNLPQQDSWMSAFHRNRWPLWTGFRKCIAQRCFIP